MTRWASFSGWPRGATLAARSQSHGPSGPGNTILVWSDNTQDVQRAMQIIQEMKQGGPAATQPQSPWTCQIAESTGWHSLGLPDDG